MGLPRSSVVAALLITLPGGAVAQGPDQRYLDLVGRYAHGERAEAVAGLEAFTEDELKAAFATLRPFALRARSYIPFRAAVMLHADRHWLERTTWLASEQGAPECSAGVHQQMAERLVALAMGQEGGGSFGRRFHLAMAFRWHAELCLDEALRWARSGLRWYPRDPALLLARGTLEEVLGTTVYPRQRPPITGLTPRQREVALGAHTEGRLSLERARQAFTEAVAADPGLHEARLRLGRVQWRLGQGDRGRTDLEAVVAQSRHASLRYLAHLFLGRVHEDAGRLEEAEKRYRAALALGPEAQVAAIALSHVLQLAGDPDEARRVLREGVPAAGRRTGGDPYWRYLLGPTVAAEALADDLRRETLQ